MTEPQDRRWEEFDRIVEGLDLDLSFPDVTPEPVAQPVEPETPTFDWDAPRADDDLSYRDPSRLPRRPWTPRTLLAVIGLCGAPLGLALATMLGVFLPRVVVVLAAVIFVGAAIYLISRLPEHGPGRRDWPDDGAVL